MGGAAGFRGFRLVLPLVVAGALLAAPSASLWAQEVEVPETTEITESLEGAVDDVTDPTSIDLDDLTKKQLRRLCRARPELRTTEECREVLRKPSPTGGTFSLPTRTPSEGSRAATAGGPSRGQSAGGRPRIDVQKTNDADGDGVYTAAEVSRRSGADVPFRVRIKNVGQVSVTIRRITDNYEATTIEVCQEMVGDRIGPGISAVCNFTLEDYAPPPNDSQANTARATVKESRGSRTASDSDISTVTTLDGGDRVLGATASNPEAGGRSEDFADTGLYLARLIALAFGLLAAGATLLRLGRRTAPGTTH